MTDPFASITREIARARASADGIKPRSEGDRRMLAAFDSLVLAVEMLADEVRKQVRTKP